MFLQHQINILEWFLKDCVTLKMSNDAEENKINFKIKIKKIIWKINYILK